MTVVWAIGLLVSNAEDLFGVYHANWAVPLRFTDNQLRNLFRPAGLVDLVRQPAKESPATFGQCRRRPDSRMNDEEITMHHGGSGMARSRRST
jgi:hypothetical protein